MNFNLQLIVELKSWSNLREKDRIIRVTDILLEA